MFLPDSGDSRYSLVYGSITPISASIFIWPSLLYFSTLCVSYKVQILAFRAYQLIQNDLHILRSLIISATLFFFQIRSHA